MEKQDFQAGESQLQNSNSTTSYIEQQKTSKYESRKTALSHAPDQTGKQKKHFRVAVK